jgi:hypothetical protein
MFAMVLLTASVLVRLFLARRAAVGAGQVQAAYFRVYQGAAEPEASAQLARHFTNLFEAPVLFYAACLAAAMLPPSALCLALAWAYVAARAVHTIVHTGRNRLPPRIAAYFTSWALLLALWIVLVARVAA